MFRLPRLAANLQRSFSSTSFLAPAALRNVNCDVLDDVAMRRILSLDLYNKFAETRTTGKKLAKEDANELADAVRRWAEEKGVSTYSHYFSPLRGPVAAEKLETFIDLNFKTTRIRTNLSGTELFQTETDGSSFPNGGLRVTHEAASFMNWDTASPPFIRKNTLYIPSAFVAWSGDALDYKTPLLRSNEAVGKQSLRLLKSLGDRKSKQVLSNVGWEQEFFVIDREMFLARPDLVQTGRTLIGADIYKGQEQCTNYFAKQPPRVKAMLDEAREEMWRLGITIDCVHNEVAPSQFELSPIFSLTNLAADTNTVVMEILEEVAFRHGLAVLYHEKPFANVNGTGKHNNWGLNTDTGHNLFVPGSTKAEQTRFVAFTAALMRALNKHGDLLRIGVATSGNDFRLGQHEAPPPVLTLGLGKTLEAFIRKVGEGGPMNGYGTEDKFIEIAGSAPGVKANPEDRNRTAPFPWCGNRFEFRAVGGAQQIAFPLTMVNAAMAEGLAYMADRVDAGEDVEEVIRSTIRENEGVLFSGDGYNPETILQVAEAGNLFNIKSSPEAYEHLTSPKNVELLANQGVFSKRETEAMRNILEEAFTNEVVIEARTLLGMLKRSVAPAALEDFRATADLGFQSAYTDSKRDNVQSLVASIDKLQAALKQVPEDCAASASYAHNTLRPLMEEARVYADALEETVNEAVWPFPTYNEILRNHH